MTTQPTTNEAASRLRSHLANLTTETVYDVAWLDALDAALAVAKAEGAQEAVERIRVKVEALRTIEGTIGFSVPWHENVLHVLRDEEAAR